MQVNLLAEISKNVQKCNILEKKTENLDSADYRPQYDNFFRS